MTCTAEAREFLGSFVKRASKNFLVIRATNAFGEPETARVTPANLAEFYATQAGNLLSGMRTLAGLAGDWRPISTLAGLALSWFKKVNPEGIRKAARKVGLTPMF